MGEKKALQKERAAAKNEKAIVAALTEITEAVGNSPSLHDFFAAIHAIVAGLMPAKNFYIAFYEKDEAGDEFVTFPYFKDESDLPPAGRVPLKKTFTGYVIRTGSALLADQKTADRLVASGKVEKGSGTDSAIWLGIPLKTREQTVGAVAVQSYDRRDEYGENEKQILSFISSQIAIAIELMRYREKLEDLVRQRTEELVEEKKIQETLYEISQAVYQASNLRDFLIAVQEKIGRLMDARNFYVALYDPLIGKYNFPYFADEFDSSDTHAPEDLHHSLTDYVRRRGPLLADHTVHRRLIKEGKVSGVVGTDSLVWLGVPLLVPGKNQAIGVMTVQSYEDRRRYSEKEKKILLNVSTTVALAIDRINLITDLFHHFNNAVTGIRGNAEILLHSNQNDVAWLERLEQYIQHCAAAAETRGKPLAQAEIKKIAQSLLQAQRNNETRIGRIIKGIEEASRRMNAVYTPLLSNDRARTR